MKTHLSQIDELENQIMTSINKDIMNLVSIKYSQQISEIVKFQIKPIIQDRIDGIIWINELKDNLSLFIRQYQQELNEEKKRLNLRMDFLEQRFLDFYRKVEEEYKRK